MSARFDAPAPTAEQRVRGVAKQALVRVTLAASIGLSATGGAVVGRRIAGIPGAVVGGIVGGLVGGGFWFGRQLAS